MGIPVPKRLVPKPHFTRFGIGNLWKNNFYNSWRRMYSVISDGDNVIALILAWLPHKGYERRFG